MYIKFKMNNKFNYYEDLKTSFNKNHFKIVYPLCYIEVDKNNEIKLLSRKEITNKYNYLFYIENNINKKFISSWINDKTIKELEYIPNKYKYNRNQLKRFSINGYYDNVELFNSIYLLKDNNYINKFITDEFDISNDNKYITENKLMYEYFKEYNNCTFFTKREFYKELRKILFNLNVYEIKINNVYYFINIKLKLDSLNNIMDFE